MTLKLGYLAATAIFLTLLLVLAWRRIAAKRFRPLLYWPTIVASTAAGTTADFATRSLGIGCSGDSFLLLTGMLLSFLVWHRTLGSISVDPVSEPRAETFHWVTITFSQTLSATLGDFLDKPIDKGGLAFSRPLASAVLATAILALIFLLPQCAEKPVERASGT